MRVLLASTRGAGHFAPLLPFAHALRLRGHDLLAAGPPSLRPTIEGAGLELWEYADPPADELDAVWARVPTLSPDEANVVVVGEIFGRLNSTASLPRLLQACSDWEPDLVLRETAQFGAAIAAELHGIPHVRVAVSLAAMEGESLAIAAGAVDSLRVGAGLPPDPAADRLRNSPYLTTFPASFEDPSAPAQPVTHRFRDPAWDEPGHDLPNWWGESRGPLLYVTLGSVAGGLPMGPPTFGAIVRALDGLPLRTLLTVGREIDVAAIAAQAPATVRVERWVPQADVLAHADAVLCHGGAGSTLGALAAGLPQVVLPLFADQPHNAARVEATGAGVVAEPEAGAIRAALERVLGDPGLRERAEGLAAEMRAHQPVEAAVELLAEIRAG
jgi:UDP:flavonoid glycosyltransferase YjiC (YdhE family)